MGGGQTIGDVRLPHPSPSLMRGPMGDGGGIYPERVVRTSRWIPAYAGMTKRDGMTMGGGQTTIKEPPTLSASGRPGGEKPRFRPIAAEPQLSVRAHRSTQWVTMAVRNSNRSVA